MKDILDIKFKSLLKDNVSQDYAYNMLIRASVELIDKDAPKWEYIAALFFSYYTNKQVFSKMQELSDCRFL